jgi:Photosynthesis system II assembly factor YCF48
MQSIPKIVRERLKAAPVSVNHPEANVLTAFSEQLLSEVERTALLEHLSGCRECREIVALALPETDTTIGVKVPGRSGWLTWPSFRWGFAAAGIVAIAVIGLVEYQRPKQASLVADKESRDQILATHDQGGPQLPATDEPNSIPKIGQPPAAARTEEARQTEPQLTHGGRATHSGQMASSASRGSGFGPKMPVQWQQQQQTTEVQAHALDLKAPPATLKQQSADTSANLNGLATQGTQAQASQALMAVQAQAQPAPLPRQPSEQFFDYNAGVGKAKPASNSYHGAAAVFGGPVARWNISATGALQRSLDEGATWQDVDVNADAAGASTLAVMARASRAKVAQEKDADKRVPRAPEPPPVFRVVAANGADIWAAGSNGVVYHSLDFGNHWTRVLLSSAGTALTGDVVGLEFSDSQHGKITTSVGELWTTSDGGFTWVKP